MSDLRIRDITPGSDDGSSGVKTGPNVELFRQYLLEEHKGNEAVVDHILMQSCVAAGMFAPPAKEGERSVRKILAVGKVQSGKTSFFLGVAAYAFDNGIPVCYILGGSKRELLKQNYRRLRRVFRNNDKVRFYSIDEYAKGNGWNCQDVEGDLRFGRFVFIIGLKQGSKRRNIGAFGRLARAGLANVPSLFIDDEGDEMSPGNRSSKAPNAIPKRIEELIGSLQTVTYLSVTATPQANLLMSTLEGLSPDTGVIVDPGEGYIGLADYLESDYHLVKIIDGDDMNDGGIPRSLESAFIDYIGGIAIKRLCKERDKPFSMMIHTSLSVDAHEEDVRRIETLIDRVRDSLSSEGDSCRAMEERFEEYYANYISEYGISLPGLDEFLLEVREALSDRKLRVLLVNFRHLQDQEPEQDWDWPYTVYVGGNMLGRGLTIPNLIVTYFMRDSKVPQVDTVYQRARWLGYKFGYFDVCKVYMTAKLADQFRAIEEHESSLLVSLRNYLDLTPELKKFPRVFNLDQEQTSLILTRPSVARTVRITGEVPARTRLQNTSTDWTPQEVLDNSALFWEFKKSHDGEATIRNLALNDKRDFQEAWMLLRFPYSRFWEEFLMRYRFPRTNYGESVCDRHYFDAIMNEVKAGNRPDELNVIVYRHKYGEQRQDANDFVHAVRNLNQGSNAGTKFPGDIHVPEFENFTAVGIHLVYQSDEEQEDRSKWKIMLTFSNPHTKEMIRSSLAVTGDNDYGE